MEGRHQTKAQKPPRATASHFSGDLDRQARLIVEGSKIDTDRPDLEAVLCMRWAAAMQQEWTPHE
jgi:hypothetical protein